METIKDESNYIIERCKINLPLKTGNAMAMKQVLSDSVAKVSNIKSSDAVMDSIFTNMNSNVSFYDSYCTKMSYITSNQMICLNQDVSHFLR